MSSRPRTSRPPTGSGRWPKSEPEEDAFEPADVFAQEAEAPELLSEPAPVEPAIGFEQTTPVALETAAIDEPEIDEPEIDEPEIDAEPFAPFASPPAFSQAATFDASPGFGRSAAFDPLSEAEEPAQTEAEEAAAQEPSLSTREVIEQARAAARAAAKRGDAAPQVAPTKPPRQPFSLFPGLGGGQKGAKRRTGSTLKTALLVFALAASTGVMLAGYLSQSDSKSSLPKRVADAKAAGKPGLVTGGEVDPNAGPRVAMALTPKPIEEAGGPPLTGFREGPQVDAAALYGEAVRQVDAKDPHGLDALRRGRQPGLPPAQSTWPTSTRTARPA